MNKLKVNLSVLSTVLVMIMAASVINAKDCEKFCRGNIKALNKEVDSLAKQISYIKDKLNTMMTEGKAGETQEATSEEPTPSDSTDDGLIRWTDEFSKAGQEYFSKNWPKISHGEVCWPHADWPKFQLSDADEKVRIKMCEKRKAEQEAKIRAYYESDKYWNQKKAAIEQKARKEAQFKEGLAKDTKLSPAKFEKEYQRSLKERRDREAAKEALAEQQEMLNERKYFIPRAIAIRKKAEFERAQRELAEQKTIQRELAKEQGVQAKRDKTLQAHQEMQSKKWAATPNDQIQ